MRLVKFIDGESEIERWVSPAHVSMIIPGYMLPGDGPPIAIPTQVFVGGAVFSFAGTMDELMQLLERDDGDS